MEELVWTTRKIEKLFRKKLHNSNLQNDEKKGLIPLPSRVQRGKIQARCWNNSQLPLIGERYGFLKKPSSCQTLCVYTAKGGVLKTTFSFNLARATALNGIKTLVIGLDVQCSISDLLSKNLDQYDSIDDIDSYPGLFDVVKGSADLNEVIHQSDLPTLHYIPESPSISNLEHEFSSKDNKVNNLKKYVDELKSNYDCIIFDCSPSWSVLIKNALYASDHIISPIGCDVGSYRSVSQNVQRISNFKEINSLDWKSFTMVPTLKENSKISGQIEAQYRLEYSDYVSVNSIRRTVLGQENSLKFVSTLEDSPSSSLSDDYFNVVGEVWKKVLGE